MRWQRLWPSAAVVILAVQSASAQMVPLRGKVTLKQSNGTVVPVAGAEVDIYRTDIRATLHTTTDPTGAYQLAGVPMLGTYTIVVSARGARPAFTTGVRPSRSPDNDFTLTPGDGSRPSLEQITAFEQASRDVEARNRLDEAIGKYREALTARPDDPTVLTNLSEALRRRGAERWNAAIKPESSSGRELARKDWIEAAEVARRALGHLGSGADTGAGRRQSRHAAAAAHARAMGLVAKWVGASVEQSDTAWQAYRQLMALEPDPAARAALLNEALEMLGESGNLSLAIGESRKVLTANPNHLLAHYVLGFALFGTGDKKNYQESADRLQWYVDHAPASARERSSAMDALKFLQESEQIRPRPRKPTT